MLKSVRDNEYILSGYRPETQSLKECFRSVWYLHNETGTRNQINLPNSREPAELFPVNIYTHVVGAAFFLAMPIYAYKALYLHYPQATRADIVVFSTFFYGVSICFFLSVTFHVFANHSPRVQSLVNQLDYLGIVILMWGSTIPSIYYGLYCDTGLQMAYWTNVLCPFLKFVMLLSCAPSLCLFCFHFNSVDATDYLLRCLYSRLHA